MPKTLLKSLIVTSLASLALFLPITSKHTDTSGGLMFKPVAAIQPISNSPYSYKENLHATIEKQTSGTWSGTHEDWLRAAGIDPSDFGNVDYIVSRESGWNPNAMNPIGACSLVQALPCSKIPGDWHNPVDALRWQHGYVNARFGGYAGAVAYWKAHGNY